MSDEVLCKIKECNNTVCNIICGVKNNIPNSAMSISIGLDYCKFHVFEHIVINLEKKTINHPWVDVLRVMFNINDSTIIMK